MYEKTAGEENYFDLKAYAQATVRLPEKFQEGNVAPISNVTSSQTSPAAVASVRGQTETSVPAEVASDTVKPQAPGITNQVFSGEGISAVSASPNLAEILAQNSSGNKVVNTKEY